MSTWRLLGALLLSVTVVSGCGKKVDNAAHAPAIRELTSAAPSWVDRSALGRRLWKIEQAFYESRRYLPAWVDGVETTPHGKDLIQQRSEEHTSELQSQSNLVCRL